MKMKSFFVLAFCLTTLFAFAQSPIGKGGTQWNFGFSGNSHYWPVYVSYDIGVHPDITIGPQAGLDLGFNYLNLGFRGDYHFNTLMGIPTDWDFYAGATTGFSIRLRDNTVNANHGFLIGLQVGGRWYWNDRWGLNVEFGGSNLFGTGRLGVSMKM
jgi:outer membrane immunogenic protein